MIHNFPLEGTRLDRRSSTRFPLQLRVRLLASAAFLDADADVGGSPLLELYGHTSDLSDSGASVILPMIHFDPRSCGRGRELMIEIELSESSVEIRAEAVRGNSLNEYGARGFRLALMFSELSEPVRSLITSCLPRRSARDHTLI